MSLRKNKKILWTILIVSWLANLVLRYQLHFTTRYYFNVPAHLTINDYILVGLVCSAILMNSLSKFNVHSEYYRMGILSLRWLIIVSTLLSFMPSLSYINYGSYGWDSVIHNLLLPVVPWVVNLPARLLAFTYLIAAYLLIPPLGKKKKPVPIIRRSIYEQQIRIKKIKAWLQFITLYFWLLSIWSRYNFHFTSLNQSGPRTFTFIDYIILLVAISTVFFTIKAKQKSQSTFYIAEAVSADLLFVLLIITPVPFNLSYINTNWYFPFHDLLLPILPKTNNLIIYYSSFGYGLFLGALINFNLILKSKRMH